MSEESDLIPKSQIISQFPGYKHCTGKCDLCTEDCDINRKWDKAEKESTKR